MIYENQSNYISPFGIDKVSKEKQNFLDLHNVVLWWNEFVTMIVKTNSVV